MIPVGLGRFFAVVVLIDVNLVLAFFGPWCCLFLSAFLVPFCPGAAHPGAVRGQPSAGLPV